MSGRGMGERALLALALLIAALAAVPATALPVHDFELENGMQLLVVQRPGQPLVAAAWAVRAGSGEESPGTGVSHLIEHLLFRGSETVGTRDFGRESELMVERDVLEERLRALDPSARDREQTALERAVERLEHELAAVRIEGELARHYAEAGALGVEAQTNKDASIYSVMIPRERLELWFWLESDRLLRPVFRGLYGELDVIEAERRQRLESSPFGAAIESFDHEFWGEGHPSSWSIDGLPGGLRSLRRRDLRDHFRGFYRPCNLTAVLVGDVDPEAIRRTAARYFGRLPGSASDCEARAGLAFEPAIPVAGSEAQAGARPSPLSSPARFDPARIDPARIDRALACDCRPQIEIRFRTVPFDHADAPVLEVVAGLFNGRTGRLHRTMVEELGVAFSASSRSSTLRRDGSFSLFAQAASTPTTTSSAGPSGRGWEPSGAAPSSPTRELEAALLAEVARLASDPPDESELEKVRHRIAFDAARQAKSSLGLALRLLVYQTLGGWQAFEERPRASVEVTATEVRRVAERYLRPSQRAVLRLEPGVVERPMPALPEVTTETGATAPPDQDGGGRDSRLAPQAAAGGASVEILETGAAIDEAAPIPARPEQLRFPEVAAEVPDGARYRRVLGNGIPVFLVEDRTVPIVDVVLALPVGEFLETADEVGVSSLTASMLRRAGTARWTPSAFDDLADRLAIEINSVGGRYRSGVSLEASSAVFDQALELWADVVRRPRFDDTSVERALANLEASVAARERTVDVSRAWNRLIHGVDHFLGRRLRRPQVAALDAGALRSFHRRHWLPDGAAIAVSGDVDSDEIVARLESLLGDWENAAGTPASDRPAASPSGSQSSESAAASPGVYQVSTGASQGQLILGHEGARRSSWEDPEMFPLLVLSEILGGGGAVSRLSHRLRERESLVYQVDASFGIGQRDRGVFQVAVSTAPVNAQRIVEVVIAEMNRLRAQPPPPRELELAKRSLLDGFPLLFDTAEKRAGRFAEDALLNRPHSYWQSYRDAIRSVDAKSVREAARRYLHPDRLRVLWVGPPLSDEGWRALGLGPARPLDGG